MLLSFDYLNLISPSTSQYIRLSYVGEINLTEDAATQLASFIEHRLLNEAQTLAEYRDESTLKQRVDIVYQLWIEKKEDLIKLQSPRGTKVEDYIKKFLNEIDSQVVMSVVTSLTEKEIKAIAFMKPLNSITQKKLLKHFVEAQSDMKNKLGMYLLILYLILLCKILYFISLLVLSTVSMQKSSVDDAMTRFTAKDTDRKEESGEY